MPAYMAAQRRSSSYSSVSMRKIQRERDLEGSKKLAVTAKSGVIAKKRSPLRRSAPIPPAPVGGIGAPIKKFSAPAPPLSRSPCRERAQASRIPASEKITAGTTVSVRTRVGKLRDGRQLVLWLSAVVVSAAEEGYLTVVYKGDFQPEAVRVARKETKKMPAAAITTSAAARPSSKNAAAPRPTTAGKSVAILKRVYPEAFEF